MPQFNFDLMDGKPKVSFVLHGEDADRFMAFMAECDGSLKDAKRYRWLRERPMDAISKGGVFAGQTPENFVINGEDLDAAIDRYINESINGNRQRP